MSLLERSRLEIKLGEFAMAQAATLSDPLLLGRVQDYRRQTASRMVALDATEVRKRLPASTYHVSRKIDGEFNALVMDEGEVLTLNPGGTVRVGLPVLAEAGAQLRRAGVRRAVVAGELHYVDGKGKRSRVHDVSRAARQPESPADLDALHFAVFDLLELNGASVEQPFDATWKQLRDLFGAGQRCAPVEAVAARDAAEVESEYRKWVKQGAEGAVVRSDAAGLFKIKPRHSIDAAVIGFTEGTDDRQGLLHDLLLALMRPDGTFHVLGRVGGGFSEEDRRNFLSDLKDMTAESDYVEVNEQVAYQMVRPEWVIEVSVIDLISQSTRGAPINRMVLDWNAAAGRYQVLRRLPLVAMISPQFIRRREDKRICPHDLRLQQVADLVEVPLIDRDARLVNLPPSQVLRREVYTKQLKGQLMVRKLVMWQTNKERENDDFPAFVIHFTDFSPNRKSPLERDVRVSNSRDQIAHLWDDLSEANVKQGWALAGGCAPAAVSVAAPTQAEPDQEAKPARRKASRAKAAETPAETPEATPPEPAKKTRSRKKVTTEG